MSVRRIEHQDGRVTYYLHTEYGYRDTMEVTPQDMVALGAWLLAHDYVVVEDAQKNDVLQAQRAGRVRTACHLDDQGGYYQIEGE